ncbi:hypothetical protein DDD63_11130 [Actinobaculum sp. 313]|nr:hypothetical protein DDD63_11130 [Actinobaculum sp. 313]
MPDEDCRVRVLATSHALAPRSQAQSPTTEPTTEPTVSKSRPNEERPGLTDAEIRMIPPFFKMNQSRLAPFGRDFDTAAASHEPATVADGSAT